MTELPVLKELREELKKVEKELRVDCPRELRTAAAHGDLSENAEYDAAKQRQSFLQARVTHLLSRISSLSSLKLDNIPRDAVGFGSKVHLENLDDGSVVVYDLVTPEEVDPRNGKISVSSPVGSALLNKSEGEEVVVKLPSGTKEYEITEIHTIHERLLSKSED